MMLRFLFIIAVLFFAETATATLTLVCPLRQFELKYTTTQYLCQKKNLSLSLPLSRSLLSIVSCFSYFKKLSAERKNPNRPIKSCRPIRSCVESSGEANG